VKLLVKAVAGLSVGLLVAGATAVPQAWAREAATTTAPTVTALSRTSGSQWGGQRLTVRGTNLGHVSSVLFGSKRGYELTVLSDTALQVTTPIHGPALINVRVDGWSGRSHANAATRYRFIKAKPSYKATRLNQGMTAAQAHAVGERLKHKARRAAALAVAPRKAKWSAARGQAAVKRAKAWIGAPYSWAGGSTRGPSYGACINSNPTWFECRIFGFDCSGLAMYAWGANLSMAHYAATQYHQAGRYHPKRGELMPGDLLFYSSNGTARGIEHVAIYAGRGQMLEAPMSGWTVHRTPVRLDGGYYGATRPLALKAQRGAAPTLTHLSVSSGAVDGGQTITITGSHFTRATSVTFGTAGGRTYKIKVLSSHRLQVTVPSAARAGAVNVRVSNLWGTSSVVTADRYRYVQPAPPVEPAPPVAPIPTPSPSGSPAG